MRGSSSSWQVSSRAEGTTSGGRLSLSSANPSRSPTSCAMTSGWRSCRRTRTTAPARTCLLSRKIASAARTPTFNLEAQLAVTAVWAAADVGETITTLTARGPSSYEGDPAQPSTRSWRRSLSTRSSPPCAPPTTSLTAGRRSIYHRRCWTSRAPARVVRGDIARPRGRCPLDRRISGADRWRSRTSPSGPGEARREAIALTGAGAWSYSTTSCRRGDSELDDLRPGLAPRSWRRRARPLAAARSRRRRGEGRALEFVEKILTAVHLSLRAIAPTRAPTFRAVSGDA